jgi:hypothetical protein
VRLDEDALHLHHLQLCVPKDHLQRHQVPLQRADLRLQAPNLAGLGLSLLR